MGLSDKKALNFTYGSNTFTRNRERERESEWQKTFNEIFITFKCALTKLQLDFIVAN